MQEHFAVEENADSHREDMRGRMREHFAVEENAERHREDMRERMSLQRSQEEEPSPSDYYQYACVEDELIASLNIAESKQQFLSSIQKSSYTENRNIHKAIVCVVCDVFIIGQEKVCLVTMRTLLSNEQRLSVEKY